ncbi:hypothetical protein Tco_0174270 [Tanacetum coccineum]
MPFLRLDIRCLKEAVIYHGQVVSEGSSSRTTSPYYVTHLSSVVDYDDDYQGYALQNNYEYPLTCAMILLARAITQRFSIQQIIIFVLLPTLEIEQLFKLTEYTFKAKILVMMAEIQDVHMFKRKSLSVTMFRMMLGTYRKLFELRLRELLQMFNAIIIEEAGVTLTDEHNDFLVADATRMEEIKDLSANICLMARIQPTNIDSDVGPGYDYAFLSEIQTPSTSYVNPLFAKDNQEQKYPKQPKIINNTIGDDQIDSNIIFDEPNIDVNSGSVEHDNNVQASYALEQLALNAYKEAEKQQIYVNKVKQQNKVLT